MVARRLVSKRTYHIMCTLVFDASGWNESRSFLNWPVSLANLSRESRDLISHSSRIVMMSIASVVLDEGQENRY